LGKRAIVAEGRNKVRMSYNESIIHTKVVIRGKVEASFDGEVGHRRVEEYRGIAFNSCPQAT